MDPTDQNFEQKFAERLALLPQAVRDAIEKADVEKRLRALADSRQLHIDQWELLENEVKLALLGFEDVANLPKNLEEVVGLDAGSAGALARDVSGAIFEPIREELERELGHPAAKEEEVSDIEAARRQILAQKGAAPAPDARTQAPENATTALMVIPATPPPPPPSGRAIRAPVSGSYGAQQPSTARMVIEGDPYREQV